MTNETTARDRLILAMIAFVAAILLITWVPASVISAMDAALQGAVARIAATNNPLFVPAPLLITFFFPFWGALCVVAGAVLLVLAYPIYRGDTWARPAAVGLLAIPSIAGAYMTGPIIAFAPNARTQFMIVMAVGFDSVLYAVALGKITVATQVGELGGLSTSGCDCRVDVFEWTLVTANGTRASATVHVRRESLRLSLQHPRDLERGARHDHRYSTPCGAYALRMVARNVGGGHRVGRYHRTLTHPNVNEFAQGIAMAVGSLALLLIPGIGGWLREKSLV